jgi:hypothetical protein
MPKISCYISYIFCPFITFLRESSVNYFYTDNLSPARIPNDKLFLYRQPVSSPNTQRQIIFVQTTCLQPEYPTTNYFCTDNLSPARIPKDKLFLYRQPVSRPNTQRQIRLETCTPKLESPTQPSVKPNTDGFHCEIGPGYVLKPLRMKHNPLRIRSQFVPRSKHTPSRL